MLPHRPYVTISEAVIIHGKNCGLHIEPGPDGGIVVLDNTQIYDMAIRILEEENKK